MILVQDPDFTLHVGDVLEQLAGLPDESVHCVVTSPPYWGLRDYSTEGQIGLEATPELFVARMVEVFREVRRVLRADGTLWLNLGDSYYAAGWESRRRNEVGAGSFEPEDRRSHTGVVDGLKVKDLVGIPWRVAFALQADGWWLRSDIVWAKPNPMPESVTDRPTKAHEYVFLLTKSPRYFFDQEAVREAAEYGFSPTTRGKFAASVGGNHGSHTVVRGDGTGGRNIRSVWEIATQPYPEAHFATFPEALPERCIRAGTSERGCCPECGAPWERETSTEYDANGRTTNGPRSVERRHETAGFGQRLEKHVETTGWIPSCKCGEAERVGRSDGSSPAAVNVVPPPPISCTVLDPFMGSGTTALVARRLGRRSIGIELNPEYAALCARRLQQLSLFAGAS